jgi:Pretoxin HINT domain
MVARDVDSAQPGTAVPARALVCSAGLLLLLGCADAPVEERDAGSSDGGTFYPQQALPTCFAAGTSIATPDGSVPIERLALGDTVLSFDHASNAVVAGRVTATQSRADQPYGTFQVPGDGGAVLQLTAEHPIFARGRYVKAKCVRSGDELRILSDAGTLPATTDAGFSLVPDASTAVYNLTVSPHENYFAGSLLVHNKSFSCPGTAGNCGWTGCPCRPVCDASTGFGSTGIGCIVGSPGLDAGVVAAFPDPSVSWQPTQDAATLDAGDECAEDGEYAFDAASDSARSDS